MLEEAIERVEPLAGGGNIYVATSTSLADAIQSFEVLPQECVFVEPTRRNTLGAMCWMAANLIARGLSDATVAVVTSDHAIGEPDRFRLTIEAAMQIAEREGGLVTIGIRPTRPETGFGYVEVDPSTRICTEASYPAFRSRSFREKPTLETAKEFLETGRFLWNSGMFVFCLADLLRELEQTQPEAAVTVRESADALAAGDLRSASAAFERLPNISFDYAVMERASKVFVVPADFPWDDVGSWDSIHRNFEADENGNVAQGRTVVLDAKRCVVVNDNGDAIVGVLGVDDLVVVNTTDAVLVCPRERAQEVRKIVQAIS